MYTLYKEYGSDSLSVYAISLSRSKNTTKNYLEPILRDKESFFPVLFAGRETQKDFKGRSFPNTFIIDKKGDIRYEHHGYTKDLGNIIDTEIKYLVEFQKLDI